MVTGAGVVAVGVAVAEVVVSGVAAMAWIAARPAFSCTSLVFTGSPRLACSASWVSQAAAYWTEVSGLPLAASASRQ
ncbi:hypothetical protein SRABI91_05081 [Rhodococcoides fascians]|nr:hypothetical protein SRABI91_05081 [Rhodococcus fascians]